MLRRIQFAAEYATCRATHLLPLRVRACVGRAAVGVHLNAADGGVRRQKARGRSFAKGSRQTHEGRFSNETMEMQERRLIKELQKGGDQPLGGQGQPGVWRIGARRAYGGLGGQG